VLQKNNNIKKIEIFHLSLLDKPSKILNAKLRNPNNSHIGARSIHILALSKVTLFQVSA
jgi:hypothetical protein